MSNLRKISGRDIELAKNIEFEIVINNIEHNTVVFTSKSTGRETLISFYGNKCSINHNEVPYAVFSNMILSFTNAEYEYRFIQITGESRGMV